MDATSFATTITKSTLFSFRPPTPLLLARFRPLPSIAFIPLVGSLSYPIRASAPPARSIRVVASAVSGGGGEGGNSGGVGGGGGGGGDSDDSEEGYPKDKGTGGMSMSQKLTVAYAALLAAGGVIGYIKSGSQKSAIAGGSSALLLYFVYAMLPVKPVLASSLGLGLSAALLTVMGSRFKKSGKVFPAGVVSIVSLIMTGGYFHGILRSMHA